VPVPGPLSAGRIFCNPVNSLAIKKEKNLPDPEFLLRENMRLSTCSLLRPLSTVDFFLKNGCLRLELWTASAFTNRSALCYGNE